MRYVGDTNASIHYCAELDIHQVHADRIIEEHEAIGISFGKEYCYSEEWDIFTLQKAKACYGGQSDTAWAYLIRNKTKQQRALLKKVSDSESESDDSDSDEEPNNTVTSDITNERGHFNYSSFRISCIFNKCISTPVVPAF
jgi:hypothetical protein